MQGRGNRHESGAWVANQLNRNLDLSVAHRKHVAPSSRDVGARDANLE